MEIIKRIPDFFHPVIREWFKEKYTCPTDIQQKAWPVIAAGAHTLITAPTGSGKTLTAFLWALNQLFTGTWTPGKVRVLYISPLKALNNDIRRNLLEPLDELSTRFSRAGIAVPPIHVLTRSGDTLPIERQKMLKRPPEILITTPESLNLLLSSKKAREILTGLTTVILDEIHAVAAGKRGTHLITAVERLTLLNGEFQRLGLSATIRPLERIADFLGGYALEAGDEDCFYRKRNISIIKSADEKKLAITVDFPENARALMENDSWWPVIIRDFKALIKKNRSTLFFVTTRRHAEKITLLINENEPRELAYSHHGSLSKEIRTIVENGLKNGELAAIIATNSLELGIDIGQVDEVVLVKTPSSVSAALQRIGRSGHSVGEESRGRLYPLHGRDFLLAAVMAEAVLQQDIEEVHPIICPLDVLAQVIISMAGVESWEIDRLFGFLRSSYPYHDLTRKDFDLVLEMLAGRYALSRIRELNPRISLDRIDNTLQGKDGVLNLLYHSGGTIPDRGYYTLRHHESKARIGELDEEFVWERKVGETFILGSQYWKIVTIDHQNVEVVPGAAAVNVIPFWKAEQQNRDFHFSEKIALFLKQWNNSIDASEFAEELANRYKLRPPAAGELIGFLKRQREVTGTDLPHRYHVVIEHFSDPLNTSGSKEVILHTLWGGKVNLPFALAFSQAWEEKYGYKLEAFSDDDCIVFTLPHEFDTGLILKVITGDIIEGGFLNEANLENLLRKKLESSGFFGGRFRENAGRALLLPRASFNRRMPLWLTRLKSKKLLDAVMQYEDFPILLETWRTCLQDDFDLPALTMLLEEIQSGAIHFSECYTTIPSPFSRSMVCQQTNKYMYEGDTPLSSGVSNLSRDVLKEALFSSRLRPQIAPALISGFQEKLQRLKEGYAPQSAQDLLDWIKERLLIPLEEWIKLLQCVERDCNLKPDEIISPIAGKLLFFRPPGADFPSLAALEILPYIFKSLDLGYAETQLLAAISPDGQPSDEQLHDEVLRFLQRSWAAQFPIDDEKEYGEDLADCIAQWLRYYVPVNIPFLGSVFGFPEPRSRDIVQGLVESESAVVDIIREGGTEEEVCDAENLEYLLRLKRNRARPQFIALKAEYLKLFLAHYQGLTALGSSVDDLKTVLEKLFGFPAPAELWESELIPARLSTYYTHWLDSLFSGSNLVWFGCGKGQLSFCFSDDLPLFLESPEEEPGLKIKEMDLLPDKRGRYNFWDILDYTRVTTQELTETLWQEAWDGNLSNDTFDVVRKGIGRGFKAENLPEVERPVDSRRPLRGFGRANYRKWSSARPLSGNWFYLYLRHVIVDELEKQALIKDRIRQLLTRYGLIFRELLENELPAMRWSRIFRTLRLMELSGEVMCGHFFEGIPGPQFISHGAFQLLNDGLPEDAVYWINACDPASLCGIKIGGLTTEYPSRIASNHLVFHGPRLVLISRRMGRVLEFLVPPDNPSIKEYLGFYKNLSKRNFMPLTRIQVETVNDEPVRSSPYADALIRFGFTRDYKAFTLRGGYR
ncbi:MAG: DEAD/DEAH box helicase [Spirochaetota bacterium]